MRTPLYRNFAALLQPLQAPLFPRIPFSPHSAMPRFRALALALLLSSLAGFAGESQAQTAEPSNHYTEGTTLSGFGGVLLHFSPVDGDGRMHYGAGGALLVNGRFFVGAYGMLMLPTIERKVFDPRIAPTDSVTLDIGFNHGGLWAGYTVNPSSKLQVGVNSLVGLGAFRSTELDARDRVYVLSPYLSLAYAATPWMRVELNGGYRAVLSENDLDLFRNTDQGAPFGGLTLKFGGFE